MDVLSLISDGFNIYFPGLILIVSLASWLGARIGRVVGVRKSFIFIAVDI